MELMIQTCCIHSLYIVSWANMDYVIQQASIMGIVQHLLSLKIAIPFFAPKTLFEKAVLG